MKLSLAIPVWNDDRGVKALITQAWELGCFHEVVICDDGSCPAIEAEELRNHVTATLQKPAADWLRVVRHPEPKGAGHARNRLIQEVSGTHVLFFDADDRLCSALETLWSDLQGQAFDFCIFTHTETRMGEGLFPRDAALWHAAGATGWLQPLDAGGGQILVRVAAYPWNKIYDIGFLRRHAIRCGTTMVHNDIALHWQGFVMAEKVLTSARICAEHQVNDAASQLSNRMSKERLQVFDALQEVFEWLLETRNSQIWKPSFLRFAIDLLIWVEDRILPELRQSFMLRARALCAAWVDPQSFVQLNLAEPTLAARVNRYLAEAS